MTGAMSESARRNLVVVRAGRNSLHPLWLADGTPRSFDLVVSAFDPEVPRILGEGITYVDQPGGKWDGLHATLGALGPGLFHRYDYIWLPDDDIETTGADIEHMFEAMSRHGLAVGQPALTRDSYYSHFLLLGCPGFRLRYTNYVEIMVPCLTSAVLARVLPDFEGNMSGFGLDYMWCRLTERPERSAGIIDEIEMRHTRPLGSALKKRMAALGRSPEAEEAHLKARYGIEGRTVPVAYAGIDAEGRAVEGRAAMAWRMARGYLAAHGDYRSSGAALRDIYKITRRQLTKPLDLNAVPWPSSGLVAARPHENR